MSSVNISAALVMPNVVTSYLLDSLCIDMIKLLMRDCSFKDSRYATIGNVQCWCLEQKPWL